MSDPNVNIPFLLSTAPPSRTQRRLAAGVLATLLIALLITTPFAHIRPMGTEILLPAFATATCLVELLTAVLLMALFSIQNSRAVLTLSSGYLFSGLLIIPWVITLPDVFATFGIEGSIQSTATIAAVRRLSFPLFVAAYALTKDNDATRRKSRGPLRMIIVRRVVLIIGLAFGIALFAILEPD